jgi:hypothetical protein
VGNQDAPKMEIVLDVMAGHYRLLKTETTNALLEEYERSYNQYKKDRMEALNVVGLSADKIAIANALPSLLVAAICPSGHLDESPFTLLTKKIEDVNLFIASYDRAKAQEETRRLKAEQEARRQKEQDEAEQKRREEVLHQQKIEGILSRIDLILTALQGKIGTVNRHHFKSAVTTANELLTGLHNARDEYSTALHPIDSDMNQASEQFNQSCAQIIKNAQPVLERDLAWGDYLRNLLKALANAVIWLFTAGNVNQFFTPVKPTSLEDVNQAKNDLTFPDSGASI